jgi:cardiolipin synthase
MNAQVEPTRLIVEGDELYAAMLADIAAARATVRMESYIFADDEIGARFVEALIERARAGLKVWLRVDAAGSFGVLPRATDRRLIEAGVRVTRCHRWRLSRFWEFQRRNHRKLLVVDDTVAYLGGYNIHRENSRAVFGEGRWRDTHARLTGPVVADASRAFDVYGRRYVRPTLREEAWVVSNRGVRGRMLWHRLLRLRLTTARSRVWLTTPYFVPDLSTQRALCGAARRGVDVRVLVPALSDVRLAQWAARAAYSRLLAAGARIFEYQPRVLHAKTLVVDGAWGYVGTANFDYRSFFINDEINAVFGDVGIVDALATQFENDLRLSSEIHVRPWSRRPWSAVAAEAVGWWARKWL